MGGPILLAETPRGGPFGHRFIVPPDTALLSTEVAAYFRRAALGQGNNFIAASQQVAQHLPNGAVREGTETILLAGVDIKGLSDEQLQQIRQVLKKLLPNLEKLVCKSINWEEAGPQTLLIRDELADWLSRDMTNTLSRPTPPAKDRASQTSPNQKMDKRSAILIGRILGLIIGVITLFIWFF